MLSGLFVAACSKAEAEDPNEAIIKNVLELQFNGPDEKLMDLIYDPKYTEVVDNHEVNIKLDEYLQDTYGPNFTQFYLKTFLNTVGFHYPVLAYKKGYTLELNKVHVEKSNKADNRYIFTATIQYKKEDVGSKTAEISGVVLFSTDEKGKIGKFEYRTDTGLLQE